MADSVVPLGRERRAAGLIGTHHISRPSWETQRVPAPSHLLLLLIVGLAALTSCFRRTQAGIPESLLLQNEGFGNSFSQMP